MNRMLLSLMALFWGSLFSLGYYSTPGKGDTYTLSTLSEITGSGISLDQETGRYILSDTLEIGVNDTFVLQGGEKVEFMNKVTLFISGNAIMAPDTRSSFYTDNNLVIPGYIWINASATVGKIENIDFNSIPVQYFPPKPVSVRNCTWNKCHKDAICFRSSTDGIYVENCDFTNLAKAAIRNPASGNPSTGSFVIVNNEITIKHCTLRNIGLQQTNFLPAIDILSGGKWKVTICDNIIDGGQFQTGGIRVINFMTKDGSNEVEIARNEVKNCVYGIFVAKDVEARIFDNTVTDNRYGNMDLNSPGFGGFGICVGDNRAYGVEGRNGAWISGNIITGHLWGITTNGKNCMANAGNVTVDPDSYEYNPGKNIIYNNGCVTTPEGYLYHPGNPIGFYNGSPNDMTAQYNQWGLKTMTEEEVAAVIIDKADEDARGRVSFMPFWNGDPGSVTEIETDDSRNSDENETMWFSLTGIRLKERPSSGLYIERDSRGKSVLRMNCK